MNEPQRLSTEQQFQLAAFKCEIQKIHNIEDAKKLLVQLYEKSLIQESTYKIMLKGWIM